MKRFSAFSIFIVILLCVQPLHATISITVNGRASGTSFAQGDTLSWIISGIPFGDSVTNQFWIDLDSNGVANSSKDIMLYTFSQTDGSNVGDMRDKDGNVNGIIHGGGKETGLSPAHYVFTSIHGTDTASATFTTTKMLSPSFTISGTVKQLGIGVANISLITSGRITGQWLALTDADGNYTIDTKAATGEQEIIQLVWTSSIPSGYTVLPSADTLALTANVAGINFVLTGETGVEQSREALPKEFSLSQNYPNPFNPSTTISYQLPMQSHATLKVFDALGREVATLVNELQQAGAKTVEFHAEHIPSGVYFYRLTTGTFTETRKLVLLR